MASAPSPPKIFHQCLISDASNPTVVLLHGLFCSHLEFERVTPHLEKDYNMLLIDLPGHSRSRPIPFTIASSAEAVAHLIRAKVPCGKAHIAGLSLGGFVALALARAYPEVVESVFASGCAPFQSWQAWFASRPRLLYPLMGVVSKTLPDSVYFWFAARAGVEEHSALRAESKANFTRALDAAGFEECLKIQVEVVTGVNSRTAVVAGGVQDPVDLIKEMGVLLQRQCKDSRAFVVKEAIHDWDLQFPELFARGIKAWVEGGSELPNEFVVLE